VIPGLCYVIGSSLSTKRLNYTQPATATVPELFVCILPMHILGNRGSRLFRFVISWEAKKEGGSEFISSNKTRKDHHLQVTASLPRAGIGTWDTISINSLRGDQRAVIIASLFLGILPGSPFPCSCSSLAGCNYKWLTWSRAQIDCLPSVPHSNLGSQAIGHWNLSFCLIHVCGVTESTPTKPHTASTLVVYCLHVRVRSLSRRRCVRYCTLQRRI